MKKTLLISTLSLLALWFAFAGTTIYNPAPTATPASIGALANPATEDLNMGGNSITNVADPVNAQDVATKAYGDANWSGADTNIHAFSVYCATNFIIGINTTVKVPIDTEEFDPQGMFGNTNRFYPKTNGYYSIKASIGNVAGLTWLAAVQPVIYKNGSIMREQPRMTQASWNGVSPHIAFDAYLQTSDYLELYAYNNDTDEAATAKGSSTNNWFSAHLIK